MYTTPTDVLIVQYNNRNYGYYWSNSSRITQAAVFRCWISVLLYTLHEVAQVKKIQYNLLFEKFYL